jgi:hypothetical protein
LSYRTLLELREQLTPADHQTHRRYPFTVPSGCEQLHIQVAYAPKFVSSGESHELVADAIRTQTITFEASVGQPLASAWSAGWRSLESNRRLSNMVTISIDDAAGTYRGANHRQPPDQHLTIGPDAASPGFAPGPLPIGEWRLTLTAHTLVSIQCDVSIQIGADMPSSRP